MGNPFTRDRLLSLIAAPVIWGVHFVVCYVAVSLACDRHAPAATWIIALATLGALALIGYIVLINYRKWRLARRLAADHAGTMPDAALQAFFALNSLMLCGLSAIALMWVAYPAAVLPICAI